MGNMARLEGNFLLDVGSHPGIFDLLLGRSLDNRWGEPHKLEICIGSQFDIILHHSDDIQAIQRKGIFWRKK